MWKPVLVSVAFGALTGCIALEVNEAPRVALPAGGAATCDAGLYGYLVGQKDTEVDRSHLPATFRMVCAECMVTMDHNPNRLNIHLATDKRVGSVRCG